MCVSNRLCSLLRCPRVKLVALIGLLLSHVACSTDAYDSVERWGNVNQVSVNQINVNQSSVNQSYINQSNVGIFEHQVLQANGPEQVVKARKQLEHFSELVINAPLRVAYHQFSGSPYVDVKGAESGHDNLRFRQQGEVLEVTLKSSSRSFTKPQLISVYGPGLSRLIARSAVDLSLHDLDSSHFELELSGAIDVLAYGQIDQCKVVAKGSIELALEKLECDVASVDLRGAVDAIIYVKEKISGALSGVSELQVEGEPAQKQVHVSGLADISY